MSSLVQSIATRVYKPFLQQYLKKKRTYCYKDLCIKIFPGVFHPGFFFSTRFLLRYLESYDLTKKNLLELGAGSGLISFIAEKRGAVVTASDLSMAAIEGLNYNRTLHDSKISIIHSNLFQQIPAQQFDFIVINPPYFPKRPASDSELAWYCGEHFEYFRDLFAQAGNFTLPSSVIILVLSDQCDIVSIRRIADEAGFQMKEKARKYFWWEWNYIFEVHRNN